MKNNPKVDILSCKDVYEGFYHVKKFNLQFELFAGGMSAPVIREVVHRFHAVGVLPYDPVTDEVVLIEQFRVGAMAAGRNPWLLELVAGLIDKDHSMEIIAEQELQEEAGLDLLALEHIHDYFPSPGGSSERMHVFCGKVKAANNGLVFGVAQENEDIKVHVLSCADAFSLVKEKKIDNAGSLIALQWLMLEKDNLRKKWTA